MQNSVLLLATWHTTKLPRLVETFLLIEILTCILTISQKKIKDLKIVCFFPVFFFCLYYNKRQLCVITQKSLLLLMLTFFTHYHLKLYVMKCLYTTYIGLHQNRIWRLSVTLVTFVSIHYSLLPDIKITRGSTWTCVLMFFFPLVHWIVKFSQAFFKWKKCS